jgi:hypothetical protein
MPHDHLAEMRSILLMSLPCPPLPMLVCREIEESDFLYPGDTYCNSHDLIGYLLNRATCAQTNTEELHRNRKRFQTGALRTLINRFDHWKTNNSECDVPPLEISFTFFTEYTRAYIQSYMPYPDKLLDIRFVPPTSIERGELLHTKSVDFAKAQNILYGKIERRCASSMTYAEIIQISARRIADEQPTPIGGCSVTQEPELEDQSLDY